MSEGNRIIMEIQSFDSYTETGISIIGKLCTLNDYQQLRNYFNNMKIRGNYLIADLSRLTFTSSHGLGEFMAIANTLVRRKKKLVLFNPRNEINSVLTLAGIDQVVKVYLNEEVLLKDLDTEKKGQT